MDDHSAEFPGVTGIFHFQSSKVNPPSSQAKHLVALQAHPYAHLDKCMEVICACLLPGRFAQSSQSSLGFLFTYSCLVFKSAKLRELVNDHKGKIQGQNDLVWKGRAHHTRDVHWSKNRTARFESCLIAHHTSRPCSKDSSGSAIQKTPSLTQTAESLKVSIGVPNVYHHPVS